MKNLLLYLKNILDSNLKAKKITSSSRIYRKCSNTTSLWFEGQRAIIARNGSNNRQNHAFFLSSRKACCWKSSEVTPKWFPWTPPSEVQEAKKLGKVYNYIPYFVLCKLTTYFSNYYTYINFWDLKQFQMPALISIQLVQGRWYSRMEMEIKATIKNNFWASNTKVVAIKKKYQHSPLLNNIDLLSCTLSFLFHTWTSKNLTGSLKWNQTRPCNQFLSKI